jgi:hypothetical protein
LENYAKGIKIHINYNKAKGSNELASTFLSSYFLEMNSYFVGVVAIHAMKLYLGEGYH